MMAFYEIQLSPKLFIVLLNIVVYILMHVFCLVLQYNVIYSKLVEHFVKLLCMTAFCVVSQDFAQSTFEAVFE